MIRRKPGTDMNFRRTLPEIRCLSQGLPTAQFASLWPCASKPLHSITPINAELGYTYP